MKILVKRFSLRYNGRTYESGQMANLPEELGRKLISDAPKEFVLLEDNNSDEIIDYVQGVDEGELMECSLSEMSISELRGLAAEHGLDVSMFKKKQDIIDAITSSSPQNQEGLPPAALNGPLK